MHKDNALGMFMGLFVGDALGGPLEFCSATEGAPVTEMIGGGVHELAVAEWTDDGAMGNCIADAYLSYRRFAPGAIAQNFREWKNKGSYGTRNYCFDIGNTVTEALSAGTNKRPYGGCVSYMTDGNGSLMRLAPHIIANVNNKTMAIAEAVAGGIITHGTSTCVKYTAQLAAELFDGASIGDPKLMAEGKGKNNGSVMGCYYEAWHSIAATDNFEDAIVHAINKGGDADTVGAVTGMIAGRLYGINSIPQRWLDPLHQCDALLLTADKLYALGNK